MWSHYVLKQLVTDQTFIGWKQFFEGWVSFTWTAA